MRCRSTDEIYQQLTKDLADDLIVPVFSAAAERDHGVHRLLKALRHEVPGPEATAARLGLTAEPGDTVAQVFKTYHSPIPASCRWPGSSRGKLADGMTLGGSRVAGITRLKGHEMAKLRQAGIGEVVALGRMDDVATGRLLSTSRQGGRRQAWPAAAGAAVLAGDRRREPQRRGQADGGARQAAEEDPSLSRRATSRRPTSWCCGARARSICRSPSTG